MAAGELPWGVLGADVVEDAEEVVAGFNGIGLEAVEVDGAVVVVLDVEEVGVGTRQSLHEAPHQLPRGGEAAIP